MKKRLISTLLALCMVLGMLPGEAFAAGNDSTSIEPTVTELTVTYKDGESNTTQSLLPLTSTLLQINMPEDGKLTFEAKFDHSEIVDKVYITSSRGADVKRVQAYYNPNTGTYITDAEEHFDPNDPYYIPGEIGVEYTKKQVAVTEDGIVGNTELAVLSDLLQGKGFKLADLVSEDDSVRANLFLNEVDQGLSMLFSELSSSAGIDNAEVEKWAGVYNKVGEIISHDLEGADGENYTVYLDYDENEAFLIILRNITKNKYTKFLIQKTDSTLDLDDISDSLSAVNTTATILYDYYGISKEMNDLRKEIENSNTMTISEREEANKKIDALEKDKKWFMVGTTFIPLLLGSAAAVGTGGASLLFSALVGSITVASDYFWEHRVGMIKGCEPIENVFSESGDHSGWTTLTSEYLSENSWSINKSGKYYLAEDVNMLNIGTASESQTPINATVCLHGHNIAYGISVDNATLHLYDCRYVENPDGMVTGGKIGGLSDAINNREGSTLYINKCIIENCVYNAGTMTITGGMFTGGGGNVYCISNLSGTMNITGGTIINRRSYAGSISNGGSMTGAGGGPATLNISGGTIINTAYGCSCVTNYPEGTTNITGGIIRSSGTGESNYGTNVYCIDNSGTTVISGGLIENCETSGGTTCIANNANIGNNGPDGYPDAEVSISGGTIVTSGRQAIINNGKLAIKGGTVTSSGESIENRGTFVLTNGIIEAIGTESNRGCSSIINSGTMTMNGGTVKADGVAIYDNMYDGIYNDQGILYINGGTLQAECGLYNYGATIMTHGTILGYISNNYGETMTFSIGNTSIIEVNGNNMSILSSGSELPIIRAKVGYTGGITYFDDLNPEGVWSTIDNAAEIDFITYYLRIEGDDAGSSFPTPCEHEYTSVITQPTCTSQGYTTYTCSLCGKTYTDNYVNALGHSYGRWIIVQEATETHTGLRERSCEVCGDVQSETIPRLDTEPSEPSRPSKPDEKPSGAGKPTEPEDPAEPETPAVPETPVRPEEPVVSAPVYDDVAPGAWYNEAAAYVASKGLMTGTGENIFSPNEQMTRAMVWTVLGRIAGADVDGSGSPWYSKAQAWAAANNVSDGTNPTGSISRQELMTMLWRYTGSPAATADLSKFSDSESVADWADVAMQWAISTGLIVGDNGRLNPTGDARRCEVAAIFMRFCENIAE